LLAIPIGKSMLYSESLFLKSKSSGIQAIPRLTKVILALDDRVVVADTYQLALAKLFGIGAGTASPVASSEPNSTGTTLDTTTLWRAAAVMWHWCHVLNLGDFDTQIVQCTHC